MTDNTIPEDTDLTPYSPGIKLDDNFISARHVELPPIPLDGNNHPINTHLYFCVALLFAHVNEENFPSTQEEADALTPSGMMMQMISLSRPQQEELALTNNLKVDSPEFLGLLSNYVVDMATSVTAQENIRRGILVIGGNAMPLNDYVVYNKNMPSVSRPPAPAHGDN